MIDNWRLHSRFLNFYDFRKLPIVPIYELEKPSGKWRARQAIEGAYKKTFCITEITEGTGCKCFIDILGNNEISIDESANSQNTHYPYQQR
jgi:hypothetical protein